MFLDFAATTMTDVEKDEEIECSCKQRVTTGIAILCGATVCTNLICYEERSRFMVGHLCDIHEERASCKEHQVIEGASPAVADKHERECEEVGYAISPYGEASKDY